MASMQTQDWNSTLYLRGNGVPVMSPLFASSAGEVVPVSPKQLEVVSCPMSEAVAVNQLWHSRLPRFRPFLERSLQAYSAVWNDGIYAVAIWSRPIAANRLARGDRMLELRRMAVGPLAPRNTASWMIGRMTRIIKTRFPDIERLISYQDTGVHDGTIYKASNWTPVELTSTTDWTVHTSRPGAVDVQAPTPKVRWENQIRKQQSDGE